MTQKEQRLWQPSCTLRLGRVRWFEASKTGAARSSVWAKMSETKIGLPASGLRFPAEAESEARGMNADTPAAKAAFEGSDGGAALAALRHPASATPPRCATTPELATATISAS